MRITLLGHASVLVELEGTTCLMDPVLADPFEEGTVVSCPRRTIDVAELPPVDILVVSHRHPDHFDVASLDRVDRDVDAICPPDPLILHALRELGFERVHPVASMAPIVGPSFELFPTRSELTSVPEMGLVFRDRSGTFWNQVDTLLSDETIEGLRRRFGAIDVLFAMYASQNFEFFESRATEFPQETHRRNLETALRVDPALVVPASAGFRFCDDHEWLNAFLFPISRERFVRDLVRLAPGVDARVVNPGDVLEISADGEIAVHAGASPAARTDALDTWRIAFDPTAPIPALTDPNPDGYRPPQLERLANEVLAGLRDWVISPAGRDDRVVRAYRDHRVHYRVGLVFPDAAERPFDFVFGPDGARCGEVGASEPEPDLVHRIAASVLAGWADHQRSFFSVRAYSRRSGTTYSLRNADGVVALEPVSLPDLLMYYLVYVSEGSEIAALTEVQHQLSRLHPRW